MAERNRRIRALALGVLVLAAVLISALALSACGSDDESPGAGASSGRETEQAFLKAMIPHHESAVEMAQIAKERGEHKEIRALAGEIVTAQQGEIRDMEQSYERIFGERIVPDPNAHEQLSLTPSEAGMHGDPMMLEEAKEFDRAFIDMMIPHHQGAIRMARIVLSRGKDDVVKALAEDIVGAQSREIKEMNAWRKDWYGEGSPAGGVPAAGGSKDEEDGGGTDDMEHEGM